MAKLCTLFSGSKGNCTLFSANGQAVLVDFGMSMRMTAAALESLGLSLSDIKAVFITHEHTDHVAGLSNLTRHYNIPIYSSPKTLEALSKANRLSSGSCVMAMEEPVWLDDLCVTRFDTSHDAVHPGGYRFETRDGVKAAVCTDLGVVTPCVKQHLNGCKAVVIESNHDPKMLTGGPYPPQLKQRISSDIGHLSNAACSVLLPELLDGGTDRFILGHLSEKNNLPTLALSCAKASFMDCGAIEGRDYQLSVAPAKETVSVFF